MAGQYSLNFLHRWFFFCLTQAQSLVLFLCWKELSSSQLDPSSVGGATGAGSVGRATGAGTGAAVVAGKGVQN